MNEPTNPNPQKEFLNLSGLAKRFGRNLHTVKEWVAAGCPGKKVGRNWQFDPDEVAAWRDGRAQPSSPQSPTLSEARRRKALADAELAEYELAEKKREVVPIEEAVEILTREFSRVRAKLLSLPSKLAAVIAGTDQATAKEAIEREITEALNELSGNPNLSS